MMEQSDGMPKKVIFFEGETIVVDNSEKCANAIAYLSEQKILGFDTETRPAFNRLESLSRKVALLQLSDDKRAYLFRLNKIGLPESICNLLANPKVIKIGAAIHDDIRTLQRLTPFLPKSFIDIQKVVEKYGIVQYKALKTLSEIILNATISKSQRLSNWERHDLSDAQQRYAATDAWICREIYLKLQDIREIKNIETEFITDELLNII
ncbi:MAG: 3'-5' exonuclease domain-containing protein 2 [Prevotellaceae bacterium]|jgi:ribonuclease D|nr:3'-5' exonuclease domain-containing protein 2 [Prevotellaceae bacterium]